MKVLVTGNLGYIGQVLTRLLQKKGHKVKGVDTDYFSNGNFYESLNLPDEQIIKDIRRMSNEDIRDCDAVCHLAALSNDPLGKIDEKVTYEINYESTIKLAKLSKSLGIEKFVFSSTCSIYGLSDRAELDEDSPMNPITAYAKAKVKSEESLRKMTDKNFAPVFLRSGTAYGVSPRFRIDLVLNNLVGWAFTTNEIKILSDGTPWRPLVHIGDISRAFIAALETDPDLVRGEAFNVGLDSENYQIKTLAEMIQEQLPESEVVIKSEVIIDAKSYNVSFNKIAKILKNFRPQWNVHKGIQELINSFKRVNFKEDWMSSDKFIRLNRVQNLMRKKVLDERMYMRK